MFAEMRRERGSIMDTSIVEGSAAAEARLLDLGEAHDAAGLRRGDRDDASVLTVHYVLAMSDENNKWTEENRTESSRVVHDGLEDPGERLAELILEVVLRVDSDAVLEYIQRVLRLLIHLRA